MGVPGPEEAIPNNRENGVSLYRVTGDCGLTRFEGAALQADSVRLAPRTVRLRGGERRG